MSRASARFSVSATTRRPRPGEVDGRDYHFMTRDAFERLRDEGAILEWAEYGGQLYGTPRASVLPLLAEGVDVILDIENEGAKQIRASHPGAILIFISPPSLEELADRLFGRGDTSPEDAERRLGVAAAQVAEAAQVYDHIVVNDRLSDAIEAVAGILGYSASPTSVDARSINDAGSP